MADARMLYTIDQASGEVSNQYDRKAERPLFSNISEHADGERRGPASM